MSCTWRRSFKWGWEQLRSQSLDTSELTKFHGFLGSETCQDSVYKRTAGQSKRWSKKCISKAFLTLWTSLPHWCLRWRQRLTLWQAVLSLCLCSASRCKRKTHSLCLSSRITWGSGVAQLSYSGCSVKDSKQSSDRLWTGWSLIAKALGCHLRPPKPTAFHLHLNVLLISVKNLTNLNFTHRMKYFSKFHPRLNLNPPKLIFSLVSLFWATS